MTWDRTNIILAAAFTASLATLVYSTQFSPRTEDPALSTMDLVNSEQLRQKIKGLNAPVTLVNFWATWCEPCMEEIPALLRLEKEYRPQGLRVLFVSLDEREAEDTMAQFIEKNPGMSRMRKATPGASIIEAFFENWEGMIPVSVVFSARGEVLKKIEGRRDYQDFEKIILELIQR